MILEGKCESGDFSYEQGDFSNERGKNSCEKNLAYTKKGRK